MDVTALRPTPPDTASTGAAGAAPAPARLTLDELAYEAETGPE